jgi:hypothetical protein
VTFPKIKYQKIKNYYSDCISSIILVCVCVCVSAAFLHTSKSITRTVKMRVGGIPFFIIILTIAFVFLVECQILRQNREKKQPLSSPSSHIGIDISGNDQFHFRQQEIDPSCDPYTEIIGIGTAYVYNGPPKELFGKRVIDDNSDQLQQLHPHGDFSHHSPTPGKTCLCALPEQTDLSIPNLIVQDCDLGQVKYTEFQFNIASIFVYVFISRANWKVVSIYRLGNRK